METARLALALLLPWLLGVVGLRVGWRKAPPGAWAAVLGYGYLLGMIAVTLAIRLWDALGLRLDFAPLAVIAALLAGLGWWAQPPLRGWQGPASGQDPWRRAAWWALLGLLVLALVPLAVEVGLRPLYPWDAWMHWAPKARVWFEWRQLVPFVPAQEWAQAARPQVYTMDAYNYPPTVPLIQLWMALALDRWDDTLINLPWWWCAVALGLAFYGQGRLWGVSPLRTLLFTFFLLSLPLLETHVALAGYADLWLAAAYGGAAMALWQWARTKDPRQGILALLLALACTQIKLAGWAWMATLAAGALGVWRWGRWLWALAAAGGLAGLVFLDGRDLVILGKPFHIAFHDVSGPLATHLLVLDSWHLFWYLAIAMGAGMVRAHGATVLTILSALALVGGVYFMTSFSLWVVQGTLVNRMLLPLVPVLAFAMLARRAA